MYTITLRVRARLLEVKLAGLLTVEEVAALRRDIVEELDRHRLGAGQYVTLLDTTECPIQPQPVHEALTLLGNDATIRAARVALWTADSPSRMQARRAPATAPTHMFRQRADAVAWLRGADNLAGDPVDCMRVAA